LYLTFLIDGFVTVSSTASSATTDSGALVVEVVPSFIYWIKNDNITNKYLLLYVFCKDV